MSCPKATSSLSEWLVYIERLHPQCIDLGLERVRYIANKLALLRPGTWIITVGGTNGKGTTCQILESIFLASGVKVGLYTSPHFLRYTERVRIQGRELREENHSEAMAVIESGREGISLSYFEFSTLSALQLFKQDALEVVILEVGLGGRLDATNVIDADVSVITSIAIDHTDWLGLDRESIAKEKAGIFRFGKPAIIGEVNRPSVLDAVAKECNATLFARNKDWWYHLEQKQWCWWDHDHIWLSLPIPNNISLDNAATALAVIQKFPLKIPEVAVRQGLRMVTSPPGRFQIVFQQPLVILDVAHNPHSASYLAQKMKRLGVKGKIRAIVGMLSDKDIPGTLFCLHNLVKVWYCASLESPRSESSIRLSAYLDRNAYQFKDIISAWIQAMSDASPEDCILIFGSFYAVAPIMALVEKKNGIKNKF